MTDDIKKLAAQLPELLQQADKVANLLAMDGAVIESGVVLALRQTVRVLWTRLTAAVGTDAGQVVSEAGRAAAPEGERLPAADADTPSPIAAAGAVAPLPREPAGNGQADRNLQGDLHGGAA